MPQHVKLLGLFVANEIGKQETFDEVHLSPEIREQIAEEQYQYLTAQNRAMSEAAKQTIEKLKAMPWDERAETVAQLGLDLLVFHGAGKFTGAALAKFITLSTELKAIAQAEKIASATGKASAPITELGQQVAVVGKVAATEGPEVAGKVIEIIKDNPALLANGKPIAQVVQELVPEVANPTGTVWDFIKMTDVMYDNLSSTL